MGTCKDRLACSGGIFFSIYFSIFALGKPSQNSTLDFSKMALTFNGFCIESKEKNKKGLQAEIEARADGISSLQESLAKVCTDSSQLKVSDNWRSRVTSIGSEIYSNGSLMIRLTIPLREVFILPKQIQNQNWIIQDGSPIVFRIPSTAFTDFRCQLLTLQAANRQLQVWPALFKRSEKVKIIDLQLNSGSSLILKNQSDEKILSELTFLNDSTNSQYFLPVL